MASRVASQDDVEPDSVAGRESRLQEEYRRYRLFAGGRLEGGDGEVHGRGGGGAEALEILGVLRFGRIADPVHPGEQRLFYLRPSRAEPPGDQGGMCHPRAHDGYSATAWKAIVPTASPGSNRSVEPPNASLRLAAV